MKLLPLWTFCSLVSLEDGVLSIRKQAMCQGEAKFEARNDYPISIALRYVFEYKGTPEISTVQHCTVELVGSQRASLGHRVLLLSLYILLPFQESYPSDQNQGVDG